MNSKALSTCLSIQFFLVTSLWSQSTPAIWKPNLQTSWQWQLTTPVDQTVDAEMFDIDLFNNSAKVVTALHAKGRKVVCYVSVGTWERGRPDSSKFPATVLGKTLSGYPNEKWLDIRQWSVIGPILEARFDLCRSKGFDGIEADNVDAYEQSSGFPLTAQDQLLFNQRLANAAHARGLSIGLKNDLRQIRALLPYYDWALNEECYEMNECGNLNYFVTAGKAVFTVEYNVDPAIFCPYVNNLNFNSLRKNYDLDAYRVACRNTPIPSITATIRDWFEKPWFARGRP